jgi:hypothetical protein
MCFAHWFRSRIRLHRETGERVLGTLRWGLIPYWSKDPKIAWKTINARGEKVATTPTFRDAYKRRRCLVPADAFYEWKANGKTKQPYAIAMRDRQPFAFAGLWENWKDPKTEDWLRTFTILTTSPNEVVGPLHDRMPVILAPGDYDHAPGGSGRTYAINHMDPPKFESKTQFLFVLSPRRFSNRPFAQSSPKRTLATGPACPDFSNVVRASLNAETACSKFATPGSRFPRTVSAMPRLF